MNSNNHFQIEPRPGMKLIREVRGNREEWRWEPDFRYYSDRGGGAVWAILFFLAVIFILSFS
ncbi:MAG: hypothetical protein SFU99_00370 [Saprospiraceae bacterium]|nr:hypothetical protein [Saprospiraceae bacterium]